MEIETKKEVKGDWETEGQRQILLQSVTITQIMSLQYTFYKHDQQHLHSLKLPSPTLSLIVPPLSLSAPRRRYHRFTNVFLYFEILHSRRQWPSSKLQNSGWINKAHVVKAEAFALKLAKRRLLHEFRSILIKGQGHQHYPHKDYIHGLFTGLSNGLCSNYPIYQGIEWRERIVRCFKCLHSLGRY